jgi:hypothetical protein
MKIGKYYYFYKNGRYYSEKEYLKSGKILWHLRTLMV